jgi:alkaline phosphatase
VQQTVLAQWLNEHEPAPEDVSFLSNPNATFQDIDHRVGQIVSKRANLGWSTHGHSAVDVNLYAYGTNAHRLQGNHENTDIGVFIADQLGLDLNAITQRLRK